MDAIMKAKEPAGRRRRIWAIVAGVIVLVALTAATTAWLIRTGSKEMGVDEVTKRVGRHILLPEAEKPALVTVTDPSKLKHQPFFGKSKTGDKVLIYAEANMAVIYRPDVDRVVNIGPVSIDKLPEKFNK